MRQEAGSQAVEERVQREVEGKEMRGKRRGREEGGRKERTARRRRVGKVLLRAEQWLMGYRIGALYTENLGSLFGCRIVNMMNKILSLYVV